MDLQKEWKQGMGRRYARRLRTRQQWRKRMTLRLPYTKTPKETTLLWNNDGKEDYPIPAKIYTIDI